eukprot:TRINITY_DN20_c0_g1_i5.p1 TRINITY_DN20_c0_g1~~TRINITY_DN20_c0_g1_i5.p1  ORF type:complete len:278 (-),score=83.01 TRINITY_DN20_c0_g1_i5:121-954(-)
MMKVLLILALFLGVSYAYQAAHFNSLRDYIAKSDMSVSKELQQLLNPAPLHHDDDIVVRSDTASSSTKPKPPKPDAFLTADCRVNKKPIYATQAAAVNPSIWLAQGSFRSHTRNYIQYYNTTIVDTGVEVDSIQTKNWVQNVKDGGKFLDTYCIAGPRDKCAGPNAFYVSWLEPSSLTPTVQASACATNNDTILNVTEILGVERSKYNYHVNYIRKDNGALFATESLLNLQPNNYNNFTREIMFKTYLPDFIYVSVIAQKRFKNPNLDPATYPFNTA